MYSDDNLRFDGIARMFLRIHFCFAIYTAQTLYVVVVGIGRRKMIQTILKWREVFNELILIVVVLLLTNAHEKNVGDCYINTHETSK